MNQRLIGAAAAVVGAALLWVGWQEQQSVGSKVSQLVTGSPSDRAIWYLIGGGVLVVLGLVTAGGVLGRLRGKGRR